MSRRPYVRPVSRTRWYLHQARYRNYMLREVTCVLVAFYCALLLTALQSLGSGQPDAWEAFLACQQHVGWIVVHAFSLAFFVFYQTMAWFRLTPKVMPVQLGARPVAPALIVAANYVVWLVLSVIIFRWAGVF